MATPIERLEVAVSAIVGRNVSNQALGRIAQRFCSHWNQEFLSLVTDQGNPSNQEKAAFVLLKLAQFGRDVQRAEGEAEVRKSVIQTIVEAGNAAAMDFDE